MAEHMERPTPTEAATALNSIGHLTGIAFSRGQHSPWFAASASLWVGAMATATAYDGPAATRAVAALIVVGFAGLAIWRRGIVARLRNVHGAAGTVGAAVVIVGVLAIGLLGARSFEVLELSWAPFASGGAVATVVFAALEILRRATRAKLTAGQV